jgi:hypothetical protein
MEKNMISKLQRRRVFIAILMSLLLMTVACRIEPPRIIMDEDTPEATQPVVFITAVITEVITPTPAPVTPTLPPTATPEPTPSPTWDPLSAPIYYPLENCVASRLHVGDLAMVTYGGGPNGIRYGLDIHYDTVLTYAEEGQNLEIIAGPWCSQGWIVWMVRTMDGIVGYTPEGDGNSYWLMPVKP